MKRNLLLLAAVAVAAMGCTRVDVEELGVSESQKRDVSIEVFASDNGSVPTSRVALEYDSDEGLLGLTWVEEDKLNAWERSGSAEIFSMVDGSLSTDGLSAKFAGQISGDSYRLIYPECNLINIGYIGSDIDVDVDMASITKIDIQDQVVDMSDNGLSSMSNYTYMISPEISADANESVTSLKHIGSAVKIGMRFESLDEDIEYKFSTIYFGDGNDFSIAKLRYTADIESENPFQYTDNEGVNAMIYNSPEVVNYSADDPDSEYYLFLSVLPTTLEAGDEIELCVILKGSDMRSYCKYFYLELESDFEFPRAQFTSVNYMCDMEGADIEDCLFSQSGVKEDPYLISSDEEFISFRESLEDNSYGGYYIALTQDIDLGCDSENMLLAFDGYFEGVFDGRGHTISGAYVQTTSDSGYYSSLFGELNNAYISNLTIDGYFESENDGTASFAAYASDSYFVNCHNKADVTGTNRVAGIVGCGSGNVLIACSNSGTITGDEYEAAYDDYGYAMRIGGLAGGCKDAMAFGCYNVGNIVNLASEGFGYALIAPGYDLYTLPMAMYSYYSSDQEGEDPYNTATAKSISEMRTDAFVAELNQAAAYANSIYAGTLESMACEWILGEDGYPTTTTDEVAAQQLISFSGYGTSASPYLISSAEDLTAMRIAIDIAPEKYSRKYYKMTCDINLNGSAENQWSPIGGNNDFYGVFDGNGYTVSGLYIDSNNMFQGLFGFVYSDAIIANLTVDGSVTSTAQNCGGIAGMVCEATVINCHNRATVTGTSRVGGISGGGGVSTFYNCSNIGEIVGDDNDDDLMRVGGITGTDSYAILSNCYNAGSVTNLADGAIAYGVSAPGGSGHGTITSCYYSSDCGGEDPEGLSTALDIDYIKSSEFVDDLNEYASLLNSVLSLDSGFELCEWVTGENGYPTTNTTPIEGSSIITFEGSGTSSSPYLMTSAEDLASFSNVMSLFYDQYCYSYVEITCDINLNGSYENQWTPIGSYDSKKYFSGSFNGGGYTISGLYIENDLNNQALFGAIDDALIYDLTVEGYVDNSASSSYGCAGGIAAEAYYSDIYNCHSNVEVKSLDFVGGLIGYAGTESNIFNCSNRGSVSGSSADNLVGGVVGAAANSATIASSYNVGSVENSLGEEDAISGEDSGITPIITNCSYLESCGSNDSAKALSDEYMRSADFVADMNNYAGQLNYNASANVMANEWVATDDYPTTNLTVAAKVMPAINLSGEGSEKSPYLITSATDLNNLLIYAAAVGANFEGLHFNMTDDITGNVSGRMESGFAGVFDGGGHTIYSYTHQTGSLFMDNSGSISNLTIEVNISTSLSFVSVFANVNSGLIENCHLKGSVNSTASSQNYIGGLVSENSGVINNCSNSADITCSSSTLGGIVGYLYSGGVVVNCYNSGNITTNYIFSITLGGIVGECSSSSSDDIVIIANCYNTGTIYHNSAYASAYGMGGVVGYLWNYLSSSLFTSYNIGSVVCDVYPQYIRAGSLCGMNSSSNSNVDSNALYYLEGTYTPTDGYGNNIIGSSLATLDEVNSQDVVDALNAKVNLLNAQDSFDGVPTLYQWKVGATSPELVIE